MDFGVASVASITVLCYLIGMGVKATTLKNSWIPVIVGASGCIIGVVAFYIGMPDFPAQDVITSAAVGVASGLASTGVHQIVKIGEEEQR